MSNTSPAVIRPATPTDMPAVGKLGALLVRTHHEFMIANVPAVWMGEALAHRINMKWMRWGAAATFVALGGLTLYAGVEAPA